jgi:hypothetical protein
MSAKNSQNRFLPTFDVLEARCAPSALGLGHLSRGHRRGHHGEATVGRTHSVRRVHIEVKHQGEREKEHQGEREKEHQGLRTPVSGQQAQRENEVPQENRGGEVEREGRGGESGRGDT